MPSVAPSAMRGAGSTDSARINNSQSESMVLQKESMRVEAVDAVSGSKRQARCWLERIRGF